MSHSNDTIDNFLDEKSDDNKYNLNSSKSKSNSVYSQLKEFTIDTKDAFLDLLQNTRSEIVIGALTCGIIAGIWSYGHESAQNRCYRLAFSETSQIERQAKRLGVDVPHMTDFLSKANDFYMKILEAHNSSWDMAAFLSDNTATFRSSLENHVEPTFKFHHYELPQLNKLVPAFADSVLKDLSYLRQMQNKTNSAVDALDKTWDDYHHDETHTEVYTTEDCTTDDKGNTTCTTVVHTREVYDWTDNSYTYHSQFGEQASVTLTEIKVLYPKVSSENMFMPAIETGAENEYAMDKSRKSELGDNNRLTQEQYLAFANSWLYGSRQFSDIKDIDSTRALLMIQGDNWSVQKSTARSYTIRTYNHSYGESEEFTTCENAIYEGKELSGLVDRMLGTIESTKVRIPKLTSMIETYIDKSYAHEDDKKVKKLQKEIMSETIEGYYELFPKAIPLEHSKWWHVPLLGLLGATIGGLFGAGIDYLGNKTNLYGTTRRRRREDELKDSYRY